MEPDELRKAFRRYVAMFRSCVENDVEHLRLVRRASSGQAYKRAGTRERRIDLYAKPRDPSFDTRADYLAVEKTKWYGTTDLLKKAPYSQENLTQMIEFYDHMLSLMNVSIDSAEPTDLDELADLARRVRATNHQYYSARKKEYLVERMDGSRFQAIISNPDAYVLKIVRDGSIVGYSVGAIETLHDEVQGFYDRRLVVMDLLIEDRFTPFNYEYYVIERFRRICHEKALRYVSIEVENAKWLTVKRLKNMGFDDMTFRGELDLHQVPI